jgi:hypothetical protein
MTDEERQGPIAWFELPVELRKGWWDDTDYCKRAPSPEMAAAIGDEINHHPERKLQREEQRRQENEQNAQEAREQLVKEGGFSWEDCCRAAETNGGTAFDYLRRRRKLST